MHLMRRNSSKACGQCGDSLPPAVKNCQVLKQKLCAVSLNSEQHIHWWEMDDSSVIFANCSHMFIYKADQSCPARRNIKILSTHKSRDWLFQWQNWLMLSYSYIQTLVSAYEAMGRGSWSGVFRRKNYCHFFSLWLKSKDRSSGFCVFNSEPQLTKQTQTVVF